MSDDKHYESSSRRPASGSTYEFLLAGMQVFDLEDSVGLHEVPFPVPEGSPPEEKATWERINAAAASSAALIERIAADKLREAGMPEDKLGEPAGLAIVQTVATAIRMGLSRMGHGPGGTLRKARNTSAHEAGHEKVRCQDVILAMHLIRKDLSLNNLALLLNEGAERNAPALDRDHVRRARDAALARWGKAYAPAAKLSRKPLIELVAIHGLQVTRRVRILLHIQKTARSHPESLGLKGAALVGEIDKAKDFYRVVTRSERYLFPHEIAA